MIIVDGKNKVSFKYAKPFANNFEFRHAVNNRNHLCHSRKAISMEDTCSSHCWDTHIFCFLLTVSEINTYLLCFLVLCLAARQYYDSSELQAMPCRGLNHQ